MDAPGCRIGTHVEETPFCVYVSVAMRGTGSLEIEINPRKWSMEKFLSFVEKHGAPKPFAVKGPFG